MQKPSIVSCHALPNAGVATYGDGLVGLWNFNDLTAGTSLSSSGSSAVIKRGATPCSVPSPPGVPPCPDAWLTGNGTAGVDGLLAGKYGKGINVAPGLDNWGKLGR